MDTLECRIEDLEIPIDVKTFDEVHGITLCSIIYNEENRIKDFLNWYKPYVDKIIVMDGGSKDGTVEIATFLVDLLRILPFQGHYSNQVNNLFELVETDWILLMDADEKLEKKTLNNLKKLINQEKYDCYSFPRKEYIDGEYQKNTYPDYQQRLFRSYCRRIRPVHGEVVGYKNCFKFPMEEGNNIIHNKDKKLHDIRNKAYLFFELKYIHEMGAPGSQLRESFAKKYPCLTIEINKRLYGSNK